MVRDYIILAVGCVSLGIIITFVVLWVCQRLGINSRPPKVIEILQMLGDVERKRLREAGVSQRQLPQIPYMPRTDDGRLESLTAEGLTYRFPDFEAPDGAALPGNFGSFQVTLPCTLQIAEQLQAGL